MNILNNFKTGVKLIGSFVIVACISLVIAFMGYSNMKTINDGMTSMYFDRLLPVNQLGNVVQSLYTIRGDIFKTLLIPEESASSLQSISDQSKLIEDQMTAYKGTLLLDSEKQELAVFDPAWAEYKSAVAEVLAWEKAGDRPKAILSLQTGGRASNARKAVSVSADKLLAINVKAGEDLNSSADLTFAGAVQTLILIAIAGFLIAVGFGIVISNSLSKPLALLVNIANSVATGDLVRDLDEKVKDSVRLRKDEVGDIGKAFDGVINYMQNLGDIAGKVASNDLSIIVVPKSAKDEVGHAFVNMISGLNNTVGQVNESAYSLSTASAQLAQAAGQAGQATSQIAVTVQEVAKGITQQSDNVNKTAASVEQMSRAINGVAAGAQEQARGITKAS
ncbi:MAG: MCP four helix bundle domain-containing protein, partial [Chloroflexota bacterium]